MKPISRRDTLKLAGLTLAGAALTPWSQDARALSSPTPERPNILLVVLDAMSARNLSVYGYPRPTTPGLERIAGRATVFHRHYSGGNFTSAGTASMLTGLYPWSHRAFSQRSLVRRDLESSSLFHALAPGTRRLAYAQNLWADLFLRQFHSGIDLHLAPSSFSVEKKPSLVSHNFNGDSIASYYALDEFLFSSRQVFNPYPGSASLGYFDLLFGDTDKADSFATEGYPLGLPSNSYYHFRHPDVFDGWAEVTTRMNQAEGPWFGYYHLYSPHFPYRPRAEFIGALPDRQFPPKRRHPLAENIVSYEQLALLRDKYDEFILDVEQELERFVTRLDQAGILETTYVFITSDHGEVFERGESGHGSPLLYDPVIHIPLIVLAPGQDRRVDIHTPTSNVDLLPTIAALSGGALPAGLEGRALPGLGGVEDDSRAIFSMVAKENSSFKPITTASFALIQGGLKLIYYLGYKNYPDQFEFYDLKNDPDEKRNILETFPRAADDLKEVMLAAIKTANMPYQQRSAGS